jgi:site-specific recombinase XerD
MWLWRGRRFLFFRQARKDRLVYLILAEGRLILPKAKAPQPDHNVHDGAPTLMVCRLVIYRHGLRVSEACDLRWDDIDLRKRTIIVRRLKGSTDSVHYLEREEVNGLKLLHRQQEADGIKAAYVFINERGQPFGRMGIGRMIERAGEAAGLPFPVHVHMLRHSTGYALAARGMDTRRLQHFLGHASITNTVRYTAMSPEPFKDIWR